ncbi:hemolysin family protein [uncultured Corynebacterium sp.]|uniref:hemolysin family protein n=1 Tax=uncultured Corynebacterium sp. TaxID=159447 RepID=UPI0025E555A8|nr:hemolysin family protein [uncultured Corynebacterium sp.]
MSTATAVAALAAGVLAVLILIALNAWFVAQEFAYMSVDRSRLAAAADAGDRRAARALSVTRRTSFMLSGAQLGITVTGLLVGELAEPLIGGAASELTGVSAATVAVLVLLTATVVQMITAELYPKNLAIAAPEPLALGLARSTALYLKVLGPLIAFFDRSSNTLLKLVGVTPVEDVDSTATPRELERIVADARTSGDLPEDVSGVVERILDFPERTVAHAMVPRSHTGALAATDTVARARARMAVEHTRYPVVSGTGDAEVLHGVLHLEDVLSPDLDQSAPVVDLVRDAVVLPEAMSLPDALAALTDRDDRLACVIDEYGGVSGVLTVEDLAEEIVGELTDEHDAEAAAATEPGVLPGDEHLDEVARLLGVLLPGSDAETLAGLVIEHAGDLPQVGDVVRVPLPADPRDVLSDAPARVLVAEIRAVERHVPAEVALTVETVEEPR